MEGGLVPGPPGVLIFQKQVTQLSKSGDTPVHFTHKIVTTIRCARILSKCRHCFWTSSNNTYMSDLIADVGCAGENSSGWWWGVSCCFITRWSTEAAHWSASWQTWLTWLIKDSPHTEHKLFDWWSRKWQWAEANQDSGLFAHLIRWVFMHQLGKTWLMALDHSLWMYVSN